MKSRLFKSWWPYSGMAVKISTCGDHDHSIVALGAVGGSPSYGGVSSPSGEILVIDVNRSCAEISAFVLGTLLCALDGR